MTLQANGQNISIFGPSQGFTPFTLVSAASLNATQLTTRPSQIVNIELGNINAAARYIKFYDMVAMPTSGVGGTGLVKNLIIPGNTAGAGSNVAPGSSHPMTGVQFTNGIAFIITNNAAVTDTSAPSAGDVVVNLDYV